MSGRWPANVILSPSMAQDLDVQSGNVKGATSNGKRRGTGYRGDFGEQSQVAGYGDSGGASRFFLNAGYEPWELNWILANGLRACGD